MKYDKLLGEDLAWIEDCLLEYKVPEGAVCEICLEIVKLRYEACRLQNELVLKLAQHSNTIIHPQP